MNSIVIKTITLASMLLFLAGTAGAMHPIFEKADVNKDGKIDREELAEYMKDHAFEKLDEDSDKEISQAEWSRADDVLEVEEYKGGFKSVDRDRDWKISYPEFNNYIEKYSNMEDAFMVLDKDRDGALAPDEISNVPSFRWFTIHY